MADSIGLPPDGAGKQLTTKLQNDGLDDTHTQVNLIGDRTDPDKQASVDAEGALRVSFPTGTPLFNSFTRMLIAEDDLLSAFKFYEGPLAVSGKVDETGLTGTGTAGYDSGNLSYRCRAPSGAGNGAIVSSHRRFGYKPGASMTLYVVVSMNAKDQSNTTRRWGLYDEDNGLFLQQKDGVMSVVMRKSGVETEVAQSAWNGDRMDGAGGDTNRTGETLNLETMNIFAITYQYLSAGAVTFSHYVGGQPVVLHTMRHYGVLTSPYMDSTYLPARFETETTGTGQVGDSDLYCHCMAMIADGYKDLLRTPLAFSHTVTLTNATETPVIAFQPAQTYNGWVNRYRYLLQYLNTFSDAEPVEMTLYASAVLSGATWAEQQLGLEMDLGVATLVGGHAYGKNIVGGNSVNGINLTLSGADNSTDGLFRHNDPTETDIWVITARRLSSSGTTKVTCAGAFFEVQ